MFLCTLQPYDEETIQPTKQKMDNKSGWSNCYCYVQLMIAISHLLPPSWLHMKICSCKFRSVGNTITIYNIISF